jgi:hypothetical protein
MRSFYFDTLDLSIAESTGERERERNDGGGEGEFFREE